MDLHRIAIVAIDDILTVSSPRGRHFEMKDRENYGLSFCRSGRITYRHRGQEYISDREHAVLLPMGASYSLYGSETGEFPIINFRCSDAFRTEHFHTIPLHSPEGYLRDMEAMRKAAMFPGSELKLMRSLYDILDRLASEAMPQQRDILSPAMRCLEERYADPGLTNEIMAREAGVSEVYFRQLFRRQYGTTPRQYLLHIRLHNARRLLGESTLPVTEVAEACGFGSVYHFCRAFREETGMTPTEYRQRARRTGL